MKSWPWDIKIGTNSALSFELLGSPVLFERLNPTTLRFQIGDDPSKSRLVGVTETTTHLRFVPSLGPIPLLVFLKNQLLCPSEATARYIVRLPLYLRVGVADDNHVRRIDELAPPHISKALYGPVDSGSICTSIHSPVAPSLEDLEDVAPEIGATLSARPLAADAEIADTRQLVAYTQLRVRNHTEEPHTVTKVMLPADTVSLYQSDDHIYTNQVSMRLLSAHEAELDFLKCHVADATALVDLNGERTDTGPKNRLLFSHAYRAKTGLEFGF
jgi:hypothetical protein